MTIRTPNPLSSLSAWPGCLCCVARGDQSGGIWQARRAFVLAAAGAAALPAAAQVDVGSASGMRMLVPAETLEESAVQQYNQLLAQAKAKRALAPDNHPQLVALRGIARRLIPHAAQWNSRAAQWRWEINLIASRQINAFACRAARLRSTRASWTSSLTGDEAAMIMGHEMAHALREHARSRVAKSQATSIGLSLGAQLLGLGELGNVAANLGTQLLTLKFSRSDETEADLVGLELAARAAYNPQAAVSLWRKMGAATGNNGVAFLSTHPSGPDRIRELEGNVPKVQGLYQAARGG
ncbi:M48 family metallopeptidase [Ottowia beijingensis]|uniref:M48 family metallopeptidase n=1 Tax=Ottowia beijingensis TaxID=1207057 RepID=A0A853IZN6_9BURK|nr:M48 family metallopeptidase [Ottowia beijingensis]NZA03408.1 M48 family metallopeptidase [Ottowia beijingensis]